MRRIVYGAPEAFLSSRYRCQGAVHLRTLDEVHLCERNSDVERRLA